MLKNKKIVRSLILGLGLVVSFCFVLIFKPFGIDVLKYPSNEYDTPQNVVVEDTNKTPSSPQSVFSVIKDNYSSDIKDNMSANEFIEYRSIVLVDPKGWDFQEDYAYGYINSINVETKEIGLFVSLPNDKPFSSIDDKKFNVTCTAEQTIIVSNNNLEIKEVGVDFFSNVSTFDDALFFKCMDEGCTSIGKSCVIVKSAWSNEYKPEDFVEQEQGLE